MSVYKLSLVFLICIACHADGRRVKRIVGGRLAAEPPLDDPVVFAKLYGRNARVEGFR